jgi:Suppressor of fused protein (SUFU)
MRLDFSRLPDVSAEHPELSEDERFYAAHMKAREDALHEIFGDTEPKGQVLSPGDPDLVVNWPGGGVHQYAPREGRSGWHYVTHGLAQPFDTEEGEAPPDAPEEQPSGFGIELAISTPDEAAWAPQLLLNFVRYLLFDDEAAVFHPGDRIPCPAFADVQKGTKISHLICVQSPEYTSEILLPGGGCTIVHLVGVTSQEISRAKSMGSSGPGTEVLMATLLALGIPPVTNLARKDATLDPRFDKLWRAEAKKAR